MNYKIKSNQQLKRKKPGICVKKKYLFKNKFNPIPAVVLKNQDTVGGQSPL